MTGLSLPDDITPEELAAAVKALRSQRHQKIRQRGQRDEDTIHVRGEGGAVFEMSLSKMSAETKRRLQLGYLRQVNADGSRLGEGAAAPVTAAAPSGGSALTKGEVPRPAKSAPKKDWVLYAVTVLGLDAERAEGMTRAEIIDLPADFAQHPGGPTPGAAPAPSGGGGMPDENAPKSEWIDHVVRSGRMAREDAEAYTKDDLIALFA